eukprot:scaffold296_cov102-Amphora_coffeaeformis.AAC.37
MGSSPPPSAPRLVGATQRDGTFHGSGFIASACYYLTSHWKTLFLGQVLSLLLASAGAAQATLHLDCGLSSPTFTMSLIYLVLGVFHIIQLIIWTRQGQDTRQHPFNFLRLIQLQRPAWQYLVMAFLDVEANAITMLSFRYTTLTSVTLFDALAIPSAMIISRFFLGRRYTWVHLLGVIVCMTGVVANVMQDYEESDDDDSSADVQNIDSYPHRLFGDFLAITGGILYGGRFHYCFVGAGTKISLLAHIPHSAFGWSRSKRCSHRSHGPPQRRDDRIPGNDRCMCLYYQPRTSAHAGVAGNFGIFGGE